MLTYQKLSSRSNAFNISKLMVKQSDKNPENQSEDPRVDKLSQAFNDRVALTEDDKIVTAVNTSITTSATILIVDDTPIICRYCFRIWKRQDLEYC